MSQTDLELVEVRLIDLPLRLLAEAQEHGDGLTREFSHIAHTDSDSVPARLIGLSQQLEGQYGEFAAPVQDQIDAAMRRGDDAIDVSFHVPAAAAEAAAQLWALLEEADDYCRAGDLLTLAPNDHILTLRAWYLSQFIDQIKGAEPTPFNEYAAARPV